MKSSALCLIALSSLFTGLNAVAQNASPGTPTAPQPVQPPAQESNPPGAVTQAPAEAEETEEPGLFGGADLYLGGSNLGGFRRFHDGFWAAGSGLAYPSNVYLRYNKQNGAGAKIAVALSQLYNGSTGFDQPVEAWWKQPVKGTKGAVTLGKFYVPFALQEWEFETKWGALYEGEWNATTIGAALVYNRNVDGANGYLRLGRNLRENINIGVSLAGGDGLTYDSVHDKALGLDLTASSGDWEVLAEYMAARGNSAQRFRFGWARLNYNRWARFKPFLARYDYKDTSGTFGRFRSYSAGAGYALRPDLTLEGGYAIATGKNIWYAQIHWTPERKIK